MCEVLEFSDHKANDNIFEFNWFMERHTYNSTQRLKKYIAFEMRKCLYTLKISGINSN